MGERSNRIMSDIRIGQILALGTAVCWTLSSIAFEFASRRAGSLPVNFVRLTLAFIGLTLIGVCGPRHLIWPSDAPASAWKWLLLSGVIGFFVGDLALFRAFVEIGARLSSLLMALAPPIAALTAVAMIPEERMTIRSWLGMTVTLAGVVWVISERIHDNDSAKTIRRATAFGLTLGLIGAAGQGVGTVLANIGMKSLADPFAANQIRALAGIVGFFLLIVATRDLKRIGASLRDRSALIALTIGAIAGPLLGVSMFLKSMALGVLPGEASTFAALVPVLILPILIARGREHVSWRAALGAVVAVLGVGILMWRK
ncbi:DMT family transporter [soil metagenome]